MHFGPPCDNTPSLLTSGHAVEPRGSTTVTGLNQSMDTPVRFVQVGSPGYGQLEPHRLARFARPGAPADAGARDELETPAALVLGAGTRSRGGSGSGSETSTRSTSPGPLGRTSLTPIGPVACRNALVTSSLTSSAAMSASASSSQSRNWPRTAERAVRTAPGSAGNVHSTQSPSVSIKPITSRASQHTHVRFHGVNGHIPDISGPVPSPRAHCGTNGVRQARHAPRHAGLRLQRAPVPRGSMSSGCRGGGSGDGSGGPEPSPTGEAFSMPGRRRQTTSSARPRIDSWRRLFSPPGRRAPTTAWQPRRVDSGGGLSGPGCRAVRASRVRRGRPGRARRPSRCRRG